MDADSKEGLEHFKIAFIKIFLKIIIFLKLLNPRLLSGTMSTQKK